ncbi:MAG: CRTAC1 family protein [bacterium]|nr:CRTAC1 family protein [bacterium]
MKRKKLKRTTRIWLSVAATVGVTGVLIVGARQLASSRNTDLADSSDSITSFMTDSPVAETSPIRFEEVSAQMGISMEHGPTKRSRILPEDTGSGLAWGDYDGDGDWDLYVVNFAGKEALAGAEKRSNHLYRNDGGTFTEVGEASGVADAEGFGMGASFADYDGDGDVDLYVTNYGPNRLFQNQGDGTFVDVTEAAGVADDRWSTGVTWGDINRDGFLDLYVCNYLDVDLDSSVQMVSSGSSREEEEIPIELNPNSFDPQANSFFLSNGDGTFSDVAEEVRIDNPGGRGLEVAMCDLDGDGWLDLYVNNDVSTNKLFRNLGVRGHTPKFADLSTFSGTADPRGSMGIGIAEFGAMSDDDDGLPDLFITHWLAQENALYQSLKSPVSDLEYRDKVQIYRLGEVSNRLVGWGTALVDMDLDGLVDIAVVNGSTLEKRDDKSQLAPEPLHLFWNGGQIFHQVGPWAGPAFDGEYTSRGLAAADFDGDGDVDLAVNVNRGAPLLLRNESETGHHSLTVLLDAAPALTRGARIEVRVGGQRQLRWWVPEASFLSGHAPEQIFGLGKAKAVDGVTVRWADGSTTELAGQAAGRLVVSPE